MYKWDKRHFAEKKWYIHFTASNTKNVVKKKKIDKHHGTGHKYK